LSFTKNLGGLAHLHAAVRAAYLPNTTLAEFERRIPKRLENRRLVIIQFFLATRIVRGTEYVVEDTLIRTTLSEAWTVTQARLYLFALLLNFPGQRNKPAYRSPALAQNAYVRQVLHDGIGWRADQLDVDDAIEPWVRQNVAVTGGRRKFATNFAFFFRQADFETDAAGYVVTYANHWGPLALRLFFDRYWIGRPQADVDELVMAAHQHEIHKLLGLSPQWLDEVAPGAALAYLSDNRASLVATVESPEEHAARSGPAGRRTSLVRQLIRSTKNKEALEGWYGKLCQICGAAVIGSGGRKSVDYAHIQPLGDPHSGPDDTSNMMSLCPNHHRQLDRGGIAIEPHTLQILKPHGSVPTPRTMVMMHREHSLSTTCLAYHKTSIFNQ
jgi:hypothetical protein